MSHDVTAVFRDAKNLDDKKRLDLEKGGENAAFYRQILRLHEFRDAANVVNNFK